MLPFLLLVATSTLPVGTPFVSFISNEAALEIPVSSDVIKGTLVPFYSEVYGVSSSTMQHIVKAESGYNQFAKGDYVDGEPTSFGVVQIHAPAHTDISLPQMYSPFFSLNYLAQQLKAGNCFLWSTCPLVRPSG